MAFNENILQASLRDVFLCLQTAEDKVDVLLYALAKLDVTSRNKSVVENSVQTCLQIKNLSSKHRVNAQVLRGRARLAAGSTLAAYQDIQDVLMLDPENKQALALTKGKALLHVQQPRPRDEHHLGSSQSSPMLSPRGQNDSTNAKVALSPEVWREVCLFLTRKDLRTLLSVPSALSRVASQLLFRTIDLHLAGHTDTDNEYGPTSGKDTDAWHARRSADILARIITDRGFATLVRTLKIYTPPREMAFLAGVLSNALPKLINLRYLHATGGHEVLVPLLRMAEQSSPRLRGLSLEWVDGPQDIGILEFKHLTQFSYTSMRSDAVPPQVGQFITQNPNLRSLQLLHPLWTFPQESTSIRNITHLDFFGQFPAQSQTIAAILSNGRQLESLSLNCLLQCTPSAQFRTYKRGLPFLRHFAFEVVGVGRISDPDLVPSISEFLRGRTELRTLSLVVPEDPDVQRAVGFDASAWGVLPSLVQLKSLKISYPADLAPGLASWLIPRGVRALSLDWNMLSVRDPSAHLQQLRAGIPPTLRIIGIDVGVRSVDALVEQGFPMVRVVRVQQRFWTVVRRQDGSVLKTEAWPARRARYHAAEWLEWFGCDDGMWGHSEVLQ